MFKCIYNMDQMVCQYCGESTERIEEDHRVGFNHLKCYLEVQLSMD